MRNVRASVAIVRNVLAVVLLIHAGLAPAPPLPDPICRTGTPAAIVFANASSNGGRGFVDSILTVDAVKVVDASGNSLKNVDVTFSIPPFGASGIFVTSYDPQSGVVLDGVATQVTLNTGDQCGSVAPWMIANSISGLWPLTATVPSSSQVAAFTLWIGTQPASPPLEVLDVTQHSTIASAGQLFSPPRIVAVVPPMKGADVTFTTPASGPSGTFAGAHTVIVKSDAFGNATMPPLTANSTLGSFAIVAGIADVEPLALGPNTIAGATQVTLKSTSPSTFTYGKNSLAFEADIAIPGLPPPVNGQYAGPPISGTISILADGVLVGGTTLDQFGGSYPVCAACAPTTLLTGGIIADLPFGTRNYVARFDGGGIIPDAVSQPLTFTVEPTLTMTASDGSPVSIGLLNNTCAGYHFEAVSLEAAGLSPPLGAGFPHGLIRYALTSCVYRNGFGLVVPATPSVAIRFAEPLPGSSAFLNYGPTPGDSAAHWYQAPTFIGGPGDIDGRAGVMPTDGGPGDDDLSFNNTIVGLGGAAVASSSIDRAVVVEFFNASLDHYFMTADAREIAILDQQAIPGWSRTGQSFKAYSPDSHSGSPVCRFYIPPELGNSHFYSAFTFECSAARTLYPTFVEESDNVFRIGQPAADGSCPTGTNPVYRVWNRGPATNHRYTTRADIRAQMLAKGWIAEGFGAMGVGMCSPAS